MHMSYDHRPIRFPVRESNTGETCHCQKKRQEMNAELPERSERRIVEGKKGGAGRRIARTSGVKRTEIFWEMERESGKTVLPVPECGNRGEASLFHPDEAWRFCGEQVGRYPRQGRRRNIFARNYFQKSGRAVLHENRENI